MTYPSFSLRLFMADPIVSFRINPPVIRLVIHGFFISTILLLAGCGNSPINSSTSDTSGTPHPSTINLQPSTPSFRLHWLGKKRLSAESNATNFISIWNMPESLRLESQTLDKLSTAPWRLLTTISTLSNAPSALLRPLLNDLIQEESYVEVSASTNVPAEIVLAIKLPADRVALWRTNLPLILNSLQPSTFNVQPLVTNIGNWTILSISDIRLQTSDVRLLSQVRHRLSTTGLPFAPETTNFWISGRVDFSWLSKAFSWNLKSITNLPVCEFSAIGDAGNVRTLAKLTFQSKATIELEPWNIATNLISDPLVSFTAIRNCKNWLRLVELFDDPELEITSSQCYSWTLPGIPARTYFALASESASNWIQHLTEKALQQGNEWLRSNAIGNFVESPYGGLGMSGVPFSSPFVRSVQTHGGNFIFGGTMPIGMTNRPISPAIVEVITSRTNLVYYDWEMSQSKLDGWAYSGQLMRVVLRKAQLPRDSAGQLWLKSVATNLTTSATVATKDTPEHISVLRRSTLGLTAGELQLIVDWLESPDFPQGLHTTRAIPKQQLNRPGSIPPSTPQP